MVESSENQTARWIGERTRPRVHLSSVPLDMPTLVYEGVQQFGQSPKSWRCLRLRGHAIERRRSIMGDYELLWYH